MLNIHEILPLHDFLFGLLLPVVIATVIYVVAAMAARKGRASAWAAPLAMGVGFAAACVGISGGVPKFPPADSVGWLCYAAVGLAIVGVVMSAIHLPVVGRIAVALVVSFGMVWVVTLRARANGAWAESSPAMWVSCFTLIGTVLTVCIDLVIERTSTALAAFILAVILGMTANVFGMTGSGSLAKEGGAAALTFLPAWILALWIPQLSLKRGTAVVFAPLWFGMMLTHHLYSYSEGASPIPSMLILMAIPLLLCLTTMAWMRRRQRWQFVTVNLIVTLLPAAIAVGMVAVAFMKSMNESSESM